MQSQQLEGVSNISDVAVNDVVNSISHSLPASDSAFDVFWQSSFIVKIVILGLICSSVWSWAIIISKFLRMRRLKAEANNFEESFWSGKALESLYKQLRNSAFDPFSNVFCVGMAEWDRLTSSGRAISSTIGEKIEKMMQITIDKEIEELGKNNVFLSILGTNGVIVGLLGMVISVMDGTKIIAVNQTAGMAAVAPILSESLFTTALGIFAAIPAAVAYNKIVDDISKYLRRLETFVEEFCSIISRQVENVEE
jgi:biopolymer transport protein TolQ